MKTKSIKFGDFMDGSYKERDRERKNKTIKNSVSIVSSIGIPLLLTGGIGAVGLAMTGIRTFAATTSSIPSGVAIPVGASEYISESALRTIAHALDPLVDILIAISLPVASIVMVGGCFYFMFQRSEKAWSMISSAGLGYVLIQLYHCLLKFLSKWGRQYKFFTL